MSANEYQVTGMTCGHCEAAVSAEVGKISGVDDVRVSAETGRLVVTGPTVEDSAVLAAVSEAGYSATPV